MASRSAKVQAAWARDSRNTGRRFSMCARLAISGTTPRYLAWRSICVATTLERTRRPSSTTDAPVSSQVDSMASMRIELLVGAVARRGGLGGGGRCDRLARGGFGIGDLLLGGRAGVDAVGGRGELGGGLGRGVRGRRHAAGGLGVLEDDETDDRVDGALELDVL